MIATEADADPVLEHRKARARAWFESLRDRLWAAFEALEDAPPPAAPPARPARPHLGGLRGAGGRRPAGALSRRARPLHRQALEPRGRRRRGDGHDVWPL